MNSTAVVLRGEQTPLVRLQPVAVSSADADDAIMLGASYGLKPDEWQELVLRGWLGRRRDGKWASSRCGLSCPRQNGKNAVVEIRELFGIITLGEKWLHTAHEVKTARKAFLRLVSFFENERKYPELAELVESIRKANGQEAIFLKNGGSVEFVVDALHKACITAAEVFARKGLHPFDLAKANTIIEKVGNLLGGQETKTETR